MCQRENEAERESRPSSNSKALLTLGQEGGGLTWRLIRRENSSKKNRSFRGSLANWAFSSSEWKDGLLQVEASVFLMTFGSLGGIDTLWPMSQGWSPCGLMGSKLLFLGHEEEPRLERRPASLFLRESVAIVTITTIPWARCNVRYSVRHFPRLVSSHPPDALWCGCAHGLYFTRQGSADERSCNLLAQSPPLDQDTEGLEPRGSLILQPCTESLYNTASSMSPKHPGCS